jgi:hypothetical protein
LCSRRSGIARFGREKAAFRRAILDKSPRAGNPAKNHLGKTRCNHKNPRTIDRYVILVTYDETATP